MLLPVGVSLHTARMLNREADLRGTEEMNRHIMDAALELSIIQPSVAVYGCTSGSFMNGVGSDLDISKKISSVVNAPAITIYGGYMRPQRDGVEEALGGNSLH